MDNKMELNMENVKIEINIWHSICDQISCAIFNEYDVQVDNIEDLCRRSIQGNFAKALTYVTGLLTEMHGMQKKVIWIDVNDDLGDKRPDMLASFDPFRTKQFNKHAFWISSHLVYSTLCSELNLPDMRQMISQTAVWVHELIHMADWQNIKVFRAEMEKQREIYVSRMPSQFRLMRQLNENPDGYAPREWQLLVLLDQFRCEGIAQLHCAICGLEPLVITKQTEAVSQFRQLIVPALNFLTRSKNGLLPQGSGNAWQNHLKYIKSASYLLGPWMVLDSVANGGQAQADLVTAAVKAISNKKRLSVENACQLTSAALKMDLGAFLMALTSPVCGNEGQAFLELNELGDVAHFLTIDDAQLGEYPSFLTEVFECHMNLDREGFIRLLKQVIGYPMDSKEIHAGMKNFNAEQFKNDNLAEEVMRLGRAIYEKWKRTGDELLCWVLTYMLDPEDLIHDELPYLGHMDDLYVMRCGLKLSGLKAT